MIVRPPTPRDFKRILSLDPDRRYELTPGPNIFGDAVVTKDEVVVAYGAVKLFAEAVIVVDPGTSNFIKSAAINMLADLAVGQCASRGLEQLHAFTDDERYGQMLKKHYGFEELNRKALVLYLATKEQAHG